MCETDKPQRKKFTTSIMGHFGGFVKMKKSEQYQAAMKAVLCHGVLLLDEKIEILETLINDKNIALYAEKAENEEDAE